MEDHEKEQRRKDNQLSELMDRIAALEVNLADRNPPSVKVTPWRAFNTLLVLGLGIYKFVGTYQGQTVGPTTVDWIGSLVWATIVYWVSLYEPLVDDDPDSEELLVWIFCRDLSGILPTFPELFFGLVSVGQTHAALQSLTEMFSSKRFRSTPLASLEPIMHRFVELCVDMRKGRTAKEGLIQYKNIAQNTSVQSIEMYI
ncbi:hypothetical protein B0H14DRAFT_3448226 [Mycena olivaceomarginata]|nr:hypothetical protein B0H14DRAFT_3448226 [Mycena olivaceomarginata]